MHLSELSINPQRITLFYSQYVLRMAKMTSTVTETHCAFVVNFSGMKILSVVNLKNSDSAPTK